MNFRFNIFKHQTPTLSASEGTHSDPSAENPVYVSKQDLISLRAQAEKLSLNSIKIRARQGGAYLSRFKGRGMEFDEVRPYQPGDDVRTLDWRVTARTGKPHTKLFREERERAVLFWVDYRAPMFFATRGVFKSVLAARAAALLAWSAVSHGDRLGGLIFSEDRHEEVRPQRGQKGALHLIQCLAEHPAWTRGLDACKEPTKEKNTDLRSSETVPRAYLRSGREDAALQALIRLRRVVRPGSLVFLMSALRAMGPQAEPHLAQLAQHNDVVLFFMHDPLEQHLPPAGRYRISDGTKELCLDTGSTTFRTRYHLNFQERQDTVKQLCRRYGMHYLSCTTSDDVVKTLKSGLGLEHGYSQRGGRRRHV